MDKGQNYTDGVRNKVYQLQPVVKQQASEEVSGREVEATLEEGSEDDLLLDVLAPELLPSGGPPPPPPLGIAPLDQLAPGS
jgi:hypothetical protein